MSNHAEYGAAYGQLEAETDETGRIADRLMNLVTALRQMGETEAAQLVEEANKHQGLAREELQKALNSLPEP